MTGWEQIGMGHGLHNLSHQQQLQNMVAQQAQFQNHLSNQGAHHGNWDTTQKIHGGAAGAASGAGQISATTYAVSPHQSPGHYAPNYSPIPVENTGIKVGEIIAFRMWCIREGPYLEAYSAGHIWAPGENMTGTVPDHGHEGIWAFKNRRDAIKKMLTSDNHAYGSIALWGDVVEHEIGYRASRARIISIDDAKCSNKSRTLSELRERYGLLK